MKGNPPPQKKKSDLFPSNIVDERLSASSLFMAEELQTFWEGERFPSLSQHLRRVEASSS